MDRRYLGIPLCQETEQLAQGGEQKLTKTQAATKKNTLEECRNAAILVNIHKAFI